MTCLLTWISAGENGSSAKEAAASRALVCLIVAIESPGRMAVKSVRGVAVLVYLDGRAN